MPVGVVIPTGNCKTATDRSAEEAQILFPNLDDTGLDIAEFSIVIVFNGIHHFVGTKKPQPTFKDGVTDAITHLQQARVICDNLKAKDQSVKGLVATTSKTAATIAYNLERLFKPPSQFQKRVQKQQPQQNLLPKGKGMTVLTMRWLPGKLHWPEMAIHLWQLCTVIVVSGKPQRRI